MVFGAGLISAIILNKKRPNYKTRLQKLSQKLQRQPLKNLTIYKIPLKKLFLIVFILCFITLIDQVEKEYVIHVLQTDYVDAVKHEDLFLRQNYTLTTIQQVKHPQQQPNKQYNPKIQLPQFQQDNIVQNILANKNMKTFSCIKIIYWGAILLLITSLTFQKIQIKKQNAIIVIRRSKLSVMFPPINNSYKKLVVNSQQASLKIIHKGQERFSNTNYQYAIQLVSRKQAIQNYEIVRQSDIFTARKNLIQLCSLFGMKPNKKIYDCKSAKKLSY